MATTQGVTVAGNAAIGRERNSDTIRLRLMRLLTLSAAVICFVSVLTYGASQTTNNTMTRQSIIATVTSAQPCVYSDTRGVAGEGCGAVVVSLAEEAPCVGADIFGVPGEGCGRNVVASPNR